MASKIVAYDFSSSEDESSAQEETFQQTSLTKRARCCDQLEADQDVELLADGSQASLSPLEVATAKSDDGQQEEEEEETEGENAEERQDLKDEEPEESGVEGELSDWSADSLPAATESQPHRLLGSTATESRKRKAYALKENQLPRPLREFLRETASFFTRPVNLERQKAAVSTTTYNKAQERILCEYRSDVAR